MPRTLHRLSAAKARTAPAGHYADGGNLWLQVVETKTGVLGRSWYLRYARPDGTRASNSNYRRERSMGLGPLHTIDLATAGEPARARGSCFKASTRWMPEMLGGLRSARRL